MKAIQKLKNQFKNLFGGATSKVLFGHGVPAARRRWGRGSFYLVVTPTDSSKHSTSGSNISNSETFCKNRQQGTSRTLRSVRARWKEREPRNDGRERLRVREVSSGRFCRESHNYVLRHGLFLSLYSLIKKASGKLPWRSRTNSLNTTRNYIKNFRRIRILGSASLFSLGLLLLATFVPLYNVTRTEDTEAAAGTAKDSSITFTATRSTASVDLTVTSENGTFASSTDGSNGTADTRAAFSISTTNFTGYTLTIASNTDTSTLSNGNGGTLASITDSVDESTFNTTAYNNKWGYKPNYYNSAANSNYRPSPTTTATTLDVTSTANSTAKSYTIALGARADYTNASGTYSSSNYKLMYVANPVAYSISYDKGNTADTVSNLPGNQSSSNVSTTSMTLSSTVPSRTGYDFTGWCLGTITTTDNVDECSNTNVYNPNGDGTNLTFGIDRTTTNIITLHAMWSIKSYTLSITNNGNASVNGAGTYQYGETATLTATPNTNTTCKSYSTPTWSKTSGEGTLNSTSGTSITFTMGAGDAAITVSSTASDILQTVTLSKGTGVSSIKIGSSTYSGSSASLTCGSYTISGNYSSGYEFSSWSTASSVSVASTSTASTTMTVNGAGTLTLNAKSSRLYMQDLTLANCPTGGTTAYDKRDDKSYTVKKINDYCWMTQNLRFTGTSVPSATSNVASDKTLTYYQLDTNGTSGGECYDTNGYSNACIKDSGSTTTGVWYNYYAATAGTVSGSSNSTAASQDICPKNWHLPTGPNTTADTDINILVGNTNLYPQSATTGLTAFSAVTGGCYHRGSLYSTGDGYWWSATANGAPGRYNLHYVSSDSIFGGGNSTFSGNVGMYRHVGDFVRCVRTS